ncbi:hypothetical protein EYF80_056440 [Liparis tanakae]|uniref:Uncharacterized protein n=1 Tax=Liparis tanakae TaxID=230148 RepID=A0A4Z2EX00_9TELE|nr:hypothetical protein EYF80_056440 [Liparis tanakae]
MASTVSRLRHTHVCEESADSAAPPQAIGMISSVHLQEAGHHAYTRALLHPVVAFMVPRSTGGTFTLRCDIPRRWHLRSEVQREEEEDEGDVPSSVRVLGAPWARMHLSTQA